MARSPSISKWAVVGFIVDDLRARLLHGPGQGGGLQAHPRLLPKNVGAVGGVVGMVGGLGGFVLPIAFGALYDLTGMWTSCFMLLFVIVSGALVWMHFSIRHMERERRRRHDSSPLPQLPEMQGIHRPEHVGALSGAVLEDWRPEDKAFWDDDGPGDRAAKPVALDPLAVAVLRRLDGVVGGGRQAAAGRLQISPPTSCSGWPRCPACPARPCASSTPSWCRSSAAGCGRRWRPGR